MNFNVKYFQNYIKARWSISNAYYLGMNPLQYMYQSQDSSCCKFCRELSNILINQIT